MKPSFNEALDKYTEHFCPARLEKAVPLYPHQVDFSLFVAALELRIQLHLER